MAWVREKNPKRKVSANQRDPKDALESLLSYLACKPTPSNNVQRYLRETVPPHKHKAESVKHEPTVYDEDERQDEDDYEPGPIRNQRRRNHQHHDSGESLPRREVPGPRHASNTESRPYRPKTGVQTRRVVSTWSNATTPLAI